MLRWTALLNLVALGAACASPPAANGAIDGAIDGDASATQHAQDVADPDAGPAPTWTEQIAPLVAQRCAGCHATGMQSFALDTYASASARHAAMARAVRARTMPPWLPSRDCHPLRDDRSLREDEIALIERWSNAGAPEGPPRPPPPPLRTRSLDRVDLELDLGADFTAVGVDGALDAWWCFALDPRLTQAQTVVGYEIVPTRRETVHHAEVIAASMADARAIDAMDPRMGWHCAPGAGVGRVIGSWAGGFGAMRYPDGVGFGVDAGEAIVLQIHYTWAAGATPPTDRTRVRFQFAPPGAAASAGYLGAGLSPVIPARSLGYSQTARIPIDASVRLAAIQPHMHLLGQRVRVDLVEGDRRTCLIDVPRWDYHWEEMFVFDPSIALRAAAGASFETTCTWNNPSDRAVGYGLTVSDEMCDVAIIALPDR